MGLFSKMKDAQQQAQEAMAGASAGMTGTPGAGMPGMPGMGGQDMAAMAAYSQKVNKIAQAGVEAPGVIKAIRAAGVPDVAGATMHHIDVTIAPDGGTPYDATVEQSMLPVQMESLAEGNMVTVKYDPDNPAAAILHSW
jgi:hypothetical protein